MAIASGVPDAASLCLDDENGINAFAAGHKPGDAAVAVTRGCMKLLSRDELQGVIGHEFSHLLNGDMRLNIRLMGTFSEFFASPSLAGFFCIRARRRAQSRTKSAADSRTCVADHRLHRRFFWAIDSSRRQPPARISGRRLVRAIHAESRADHRRAEKNRRPRRNRFTPGIRTLTRRNVHMFFGNGVSEAVLRLARNASADYRPNPRVDPNLDGKFPEVRYDEHVESPEEMLPKPKSSSPMPNIFGGVLGGAILASGDDAEKPPVIKSRHVLPNIGNPTPLHLKYAEQLRDSLPEQHQSRRARTARCRRVDLCVAFERRTKTTRRRKSPKLQNAFRRTFPKKPPRCFPTFQKSPRTSICPIINLALGGLRQLSADDFQKFSQTLQWLDRKRRQNRIV